MTRRTTALAAIAASLGIGSAIAIGAVPDSNGVVHSCYATVTGLDSGRLRVIDPNGNGTIPRSCTSTEAALDFNLAGATGPTGARGPTGDAGQDGQNGFDGEDGQDGDRGPTGMLGPQGIRGETGARGPTGDRGVPGQDGARGPTGETGPTGNIGPSGARGPAGPRGVNGVKGPVGPAGVKPKALRSLRMRIRALEKRVKALGG